MPPKPAPSTEFPEIDKRKVSLGMFIAVAGKK